MTSTPEPFDDSGWFRRMRLPKADVAETLTTVERDTAAVASGSLIPSDLLDTLVGLTWALTPLGREPEAVQYGVRALELARQLRVTSLEVEALLHLATAHQYCGEAQIAASLFDEGLRLARSADDPQLHFLLHHRGRLHAEALDLGAARDCFEAALLLRLVTGPESMIASTQGALAALDGWCADR